MKNFSIAVLTVLMFMVTAVMFMVLVGFAEGSSIVDESVYCIGGDHDE